MYQAARDVDVAVKAPAVSVVSEGGVLWGTESCAACVWWCMQGAHMQPWTTRRGLLSSRCCGTYTLNPHMLCMGWGIAAFYPSVLVLDTLQVATPE